MNEEGGALFSSNTFSPNTFYHNILSFSTAIHSQSAENRDKFFIKFFRGYKYLENTVGDIKIRPIACEQLDTSCWDQMYWE